MQSWTTTAKQRSESSCGPRTASSRDVRCWPLAQVMSRSRGACAAANGHASIRASTSSTPGHLPGASWRGPRCSTTGQLPWPAKRRSRHRSWVATSGRGRLSRSRWTAIAVSCARWASWCASTRASSRCARCSSIHLGNGSSMLCSGWHRASVRSTGASECWPMPSSKVERPRAGSLRLWTRDPGCATVPCCAWSSSMSSPAFTRCWSTVTWSTSSVPTVSPPASGSAGCNWKGPSRSETSTTSITD